MNCCTAFVSGAAAFNATCALLKFKSRPLLRIQSAQLQRLAIVLHRPFAIFANHANQALGQDAVQRRNEVIGFDAHVQETSQHVNHVVGVDSREDKVTGQCRVDGDLRGFLVADFTDQNLVGIVTQNRTQSAREGQALLSHSPEFA